MSQLVRNPMTDEETANVQWKDLYRLGGVTALITSVLFFSDIVVLVTGVPMPGSASELFALMQGNRVAGILELFFTDLIGLVLLIPFIFGLYTVLRRANATYAALATVLAFIGIGIVLGTNSNYSLIYLSDQYAAASTEMQRSQILAAAESVFATSMWSTGFLAAGLLVEGAMVVFSVLMLRSGTFSKWIAYVGILGHGLDFVHSVALLVLTLVVSPTLASAVGGPLLAVGGTLQLIWYPLAALRLFQLGKVEKSLGQGVTGILRGDRVENAAH